MGMVTPTAVNLVETMEMAETELQRDFQAASSVRALAGRNSLVRENSQAPGLVRSAGYAFGKSFMRK